MSELVTFIIDRLHYILNDIVTLTSTQENRCILLGKILLSTGFQLIMLSSNALRKSFLHNSYITELCCEDPRSSLFPFPFIKDVFVYSFFSDTSSCKACNTSYLEGYLCTSSELRNVPHTTDSPTKALHKAGENHKFLLF